MSEDVVKYEKSDGVAILTLNRPKSLNSMSLELINGWLAKLHFAEHDPDVPGGLIPGSV